MFKLEIRAKNTSEAEFMLRTLERYARCFYTVYGLKRLGSKKLENGFQIEAEIPEDAWNKFRNGAIWFMTHNLKKATMCHRVAGTVKIATCEVS